MGSGVIYPIPIADIEVKPFAIPFGWKKGYALDVGWNRTAALWGAQNPVDGTLYLYSEHYKGQQLPVVHAAAIKTRGEWIRGAIDPASKGSSQKDGKQLKAEYQSLGLILIDANNELEAGLIAVLAGAGARADEDFLDPAVVQGGIPGLSARRTRPHRRRAGRPSDGLHALPVAHMGKVATLPSLKSKSGGAGIANADRRAGY